MGANPRGRKGEDFAAGFLAEQGYTVVARNFHSRYGELDIVAVKDDFICFVEVKTRREGSMVSGAEAVGAAKRKKIITTALLFLQQHPEYDLQPRFDLMCVMTGRRGEILYCDYRMGAFDCEGYG